MTSEETAEHFEASRARLRALAYRMLGSRSEADDAVQEAWLRLQRTDAVEVDNLGGWLTTVVARVCLDMLRARAWRREEPLGPRLPEPLVVRDEVVDPEEETILAGAVGMALLVVLDTLAPHERLAFVLHDMFGVPFEEIAPIVGRSPAAARQLASRARRRLRGAPEATKRDAAREREVVRAFLAASRGGDLDALLAVFDPDVVVRVESGDPPGIRELRGARAAAEEAIHGARRAARTVHVRVNGAAGLLALSAEDEPFAVLCFAFAGGRIVALDVLADQARIRRLDLQRIAARTS